ncbi:MAG: Eco57I restriction-modification methylase domain-containing protein [Kiritimatiellae bacterium]|nr:Eco57I restriction-modification methylase domain-containing protein [Kiritimatiellia bacterium]
MKYDKAELAALFAKPFDDARWADVLAELFGAREDENGRILKPQPFDRPFPDAKGWYLGSFTTADGYLVGLFRFETDSVRRRRVGLRNLLKPMLKWQHDAALAVFTERGSPAWRFSFVCDLKGEATAAKRFTYVFGDPASPFRTPVQRFLALRDAREEGRPVTFAAMQDAFSVEALSDEFFRAYKEHYETFVSRVTGKRFVKEGGKWVETAVGRPDRDLYRTFGNDDKRVRDYVKKMLGRLVFLHFLQKKGWLGARKGGWTGGDPAFLLHLFEKADPDQQDDFLDEVLEPLFFNALNTDRSARGDLFDTGVPGIGKCRIPYLNGGLFEKDDLDELRVKFPAAYFRDLLRFFSQYNFTIDENDADEAEVGIDPEMLGRIFENLLEDNKDKGAFYTPKEIVRYMCLRSLLAHLSDGEDQASADAIAAFLDTRDPGTLPKKTAARLAAKLRDVKICDPAIGSGAFPMGLLRELHALRSALDPAADDLKRQIIENNIYGVDIEKGAVDIARLRFWLALVVDADNPVPLPNLDFKIMQGNSLVESWKGHDLSGLADGAKTKTLPALSLPGIPAPAMQLTFFDAAAKPHRVKLRSLLHQWFTCSDHKERDRLRREIRAAVEDIFEGLGSDVSLASIDSSANTEFFLWHLWFAEVFDNGGFDIVIGNPPYISALDYSKILTESEKKQLCRNYKVAKGAWDVYVLFFERGIELLRSGGVLAFITPNKYLSASYGKALRAFLVENVNLRLIADLSSIPVFEAVAVYPIITVLSKSKQLPSIEVCKPCSVATLSRGVNVLPIDSAILTACPDNIWGVLLSSQLRKLSPVLNNSERFENIAQINATSTAGEADEYGELIKNASSSRGRWLKLVNTGTIDPYLTLWGQKPLTHQGRRFETPFLPVDSSKINERRRQMYLSPKIIFAKIGIRAEAFLDESGEFASLNTNCVYQTAKGVSLKYLLGVCNSTPFTEIYKLFFGSLHMSGGYMQFQAPQLRIMPIPRATTTEQKRIARLVDRILAAKANDSEADTTAFESEIDTLVYTLYGLTPEEIAVVEEG